MSRRSGSLGLIVSLLLLAAAGLQSQPSDRTEDLRKAAELVAAGKVDEAISVYEKLLQASPNDAGLLLNLAIAQYKAERYKESLARAERALKLRPDLLPARLFVGASHLKLGNPERAVEPLEAVLQAQPDERNARLMLAESLFALERHEEAVDHYQKAAGLLPNHPPVWYGLGRSYEALSRRAAMELEKTGPGSVYWFALMAEYRLKQKRYGSSFELYKQALGRGANWRVVYRGLATLYRESGHEDWALTAEEKERNLPPPDCRSPTLECEFVAGRYQTLLGRAKSLRSPEALFWTAKTCEELAARAYSRLRQLPPSVESHELAAREYEERGRRLDAVKEWREAVKLSPNDLRIQRGLASSLYQNRDHEASIPLLQGLLERDPHSAELNFLYGSSLLNMEQPAKSIPYFQEALTNDPDFLPSRAGLGQAYLRIGMPDQAIPHLEASLALDDEDGSRHYQLIRAYQMTGQQQLAGQVSEKYQRLRESAEQERRKLEAISQIVHP